MNSQPHRFDQSTQRKLRPFLAGMIIFLVMSLACNLPIIGESTGKSTKGETPSATQPVPAEDVNLPPAIVETEPRPNTDLALQGPLTLYFNQPMERSSVEAALQTVPPLPGRFEWADDATVRFVPDQPLQPDQNVHITVGTAARASNGLALQKPLELNYQATGLLEAVERLPAPDTNDLDPASTVAITFNQPVVPLGESAETLPAAFSLDPPVEGRSEWLNTSTYIFRPEPALQGGTTYTVQVNENLTSSLGAALSGEDYSWRFTTALPEVLSIEPNWQNPLLLDEPITLTFNQQMDRASVEQAFRLQDPQGQAAAGSFAWSENDTQLVFTPNNLLSRGTQYTVQVDIDARGLGGTSLKQAYTQSFTTVGDLAVASLAPTASEGVDATYGTAYQTINFTSPLRPGQNLEELVQVQPDISDKVISFGYDQTSFMIGGSFKPSQAYVVTISSQLTDRWGQSLGEPVSLTLQTRPARPSLTVPMLAMNGNAIFLTPGDSTIPAQATNISQVILSARPSNLQEYQASVGNRMVAPTLSDADSWTQDFQLPADINTPIQISVTKDGNPLDPGIYVYQMGSNQLIEEGHRLPFFVVVSRIQLTLKISPGQLFLWAVDLESRQPVQNSDFIVYDSTGAELGSGTTDGDGIGQVAIELQPGSGVTYQVVMGEPGDDNFSMASSVWAAGVAGWDFQLSTNYFETGDSLYLYTDRPIYRPGQTVYYRAVGLKPSATGYVPLQGQSYDLVALGEYDPTTGKSPTLYSAQVTLSGFGTAEGQFTLPDDARPGRYTLQVNNDFSSLVAFKVASYRKPEIDLQVQLAASDFRMGQPILGSAQANYFFGAPAANVPLRWSLYVRGTGFNLPGSYSVGKLDLSWMNPYHFGMFGDPGILILDGKGASDENGRFSVEIRPEEIADRLPDLDLMQLILEVTVADESEQPVSQRGNALLHAGEFAIGIRAESWSARENEEQFFDIFTTNWQQQPVGQRTLTATFQKVVWKQTWQNWQNAIVSYEPQYTLIGSTDFQSGPDGQARIAFTPPEPGTYQLEVRGDSSVSQVMVWVAGQGAAQWPELPNQQIQLESDSTEYQPGETARIFIPNPFGPDTPALITIERDQVIRSQVVRMNDANYLLELPLSDQDAPNIYISVVELGRDPNDRYDFRMGYLALKVAPVVQTLQVSLSYDPSQPAPGEKTQVSLQVKDYNGQPVQGEFSLSVVDKAVLALTDPNAPTINEAFYGNRPLRVMNSLSMAAYAARIPVPPLGGGGGGGAVEPVISIRSNFQDTAYWSGSLMTDANGTAVVEMDLPDNLTTWVITARGLTGDGKVGEGSTEMLVTQGLIIRPVTPRFFVLGDHVRLTAVVQNTTGEELTGQASLQASGFTLDEGQPQAQPVNLPTNERQLVEWWGTVADVDAVDMVFRASAGDLEDAATPQSGAIPVRRYLAPKTYGTAGVLEQAGSVTEVVSLPRTFDPSGGALRVELDSSLAASVLNGVNALKAIGPYRYSEPAASRVLSNLSALQMFTLIGQEGDQRLADLQSAVDPDVSWLTQNQNTDGGWSWSPNQDSSPYLSAYVLLALYKAQQSGWQGLEDAISSGQAYLQATLITPEMAKDDAQLDRLAFVHFVLAETGSTGSQPEQLLPVQARLSPWAQALLLHTLAKADPSSQAVQTLAGNLETSAQRSATGAFWPAGNQSWENFNTPLFSTAVVAWTLAQRDPASPLLVDAVRYIAANSRPQGGWYTSYQTSWVLLALLETMRGTGELQGSYNFSASLNDALLAQGEAGGAKALETVRTSAPISQLRANAPNGLLIERTAGAGRLYYRAYLDVERPADTVQPLENGITLKREYFMAGEDCVQPDCTPIDTTALSAEDPVILVRLTLTVPQDMYYIAVEDFIPAGTEVVNTALSTSQSTPALKWEPANPFGSGVSRWFFGDPNIQDDRVSWASSFTPAGTYQLTYRLVPLLAGEFKVLPAHAWAFYFPEIQGTSSGALFTITQ